MQHSRRGWQHVDSAWLRQCRADRPGTFVPLLTQLERLHADDPSALRRVLLYQLIALVQDHAQGAQPATVVSLGVCPDEATALAQAVSTLERLGPEQRTAAEGLEDEWQHGRARSAARLAGRLPAAGAGDRLLAHRMSSVASRARLADAALGRAHRLEQAGDPGAAAGEYLRAARLMNDCPRILRGLIRTHRPPEGESGPVAVDLGPDSVRVTWPDATAAGVEPSTLAWRVIRFSRESGNDTELTEIQTRTGAATWVDNDPPLGREVCYAVLPLRGSRIDGPPLVSGKLLVVPEVSGFQAVDGRARIEARWSQPSGALGVRVRLTGPDGRMREIEPSESRFMAGGLEPGEYLIHINGRYRAAGASQVASPGISRSVTVHPWPSPVLTLNATGVDGRAHFTWTGGDDAHVRLVEWPGEPPAPGTELSTPPASWPAALDWETSCGDLIPPPGTVTRVAALAILGNRAVTGPVLRIEAPQPVAAVVAERITGGRARITFGWPPQAGEVTIVLDQNGQSTEHRVTRSMFLREGLSVPVSPSRLNIRVLSAPRTSDTTVIEPAAARTELPAEVTVAYRVIPGPCRLLHRGPTTVQVTLVSPSGEVLTDLPEFVLVARPGEGRAPLRPHRHTDGTMVFRLSGEELHRAGTVERELAPSVCRPPYALRGFLLGGRTAGIRLDEPSPATLVVH
ncbi:MULTISPECIES: hypothetical protein [unclassified Streptomyces]|uniref:hypothetical protein n=1 Tax=unclassified Streptomyces TaxID=2593676 RepID=UPI0022518EF7|nr:MULTISPECIES: hypothetical protein [unclassified Streptomyces]MCX4392941.1 hypothetical protein [Streptomyces sp. NBC_01767]WSC26940.1 hypothetical protein OG902_09700 [Streptomyces sp. NBC_01768]